MKKLFYFLAAVAVVAGLASCKCTREQEPVVLNPEATISIDRDAMASVDSTYKWFETRVEYDNFFDADTTLTLTKVESLFQVAVEDSLGIKTYVYDFTHELGVEDADPEVIEGFVLDDKPLNTAKVVLTFEEALARMYEANLPKPHSKKAVLRRELGPVLAAQAQYIFGNTEEQVFVDAVNGTVTDKNPAFDIPVAVD